MIQDNNNFYYGEEVPSLTITMCTRNNSLSVPPTRFSWNPYATSSVQHRTLHYPHREGETWPYISPDESCDTNSSVGERSSTASCTPIVEKHSGHADAAHLDTIARLRSEPTDADILRATEALGAHVCAELVETLALEATRPLLRELCFQERGNVVHQLMVRASASHCTGIVAFAADNALEMARDQSGCIALSRIYDASPFYAKQLISSVLLPSFVQLSCDPFGNYAIQTIGHAFADRTTIGMIVDADNMKTLCTDKFGSHVLDRIVRRSEPADFGRLLERLRGDACLVEHLAQDRFGNYVLQHLLRRLVRRAGEHRGLYDWCLEHVPTLAADSRYLPNIRRALGLRPMKPLPQ